MIATIVVGAAACKKKASTEREPSAKSSDETTDLSCDDKDALETLASTLVAKPEGELIVETCTPFRSPAPALHLTVADHEGDAVTSYEFAVAGGFKDPKVLAKGEGEAETAMRHSLPEGFEAADLNGDGIDEIVNHVVEDRSELIEFLVVRQLQEGRMETASIVTQYEDDENDEASCAGRYEIRKTHPDLGHGAIVVHSKGPSTEGDCPPLGTSTWILKGGKLVAVDRDAPTAQDARKAVRPGARMLDRPRR